MNVVRFALERYQFTLVVLILLTALGLSSFFTMPRSEDPQFNFPAATVVAIYPGASPSDVEQLLLDPLEERIHELEDVKSIDASVQDGIALIFVEFLQGTAPDDAYADVSDAVAETRPSLPAEVLEVRVRRQSPTDVNILQVGLVSDSVSYSTLRRLAETLERSLERTPGIKRADIWALPDEEVQVSVDLERLRALGLGLPQVAQAVQRSGMNIPGGDLDVGGRRYNVKTSGDFESLEQLGRTVVAGTGDAAIFLNDVADVRIGFDDASYRGRVNGTRAVFLTAVQREGTNIFRVMEAAHAALDVYSAGLPDGVDLHTVFDQSVSVRDRIGGFFTNLLQGMLLVGLVVLLALGVRASAVVMLAIPVSLFMALGWLDFTGFGLQQMTIVGLVIALGLLVDNAIVVTENVERFRAQGLTGREAALQGASQVAGPIVSSTLTTVLAFLPMVLLESATGDFIRSMPLTVMYALGASLLVSLTLTPLMGSRFVGGRTSRRRPLERLLSGQVTGPYRRTLRAALDRPWRVIAAAVVVFAASLAVFPLVGVSLFPRAEKPQLLVNVDLPEGASLNRTDQLAREVEHRLLDMPASRDVVANVGHGNPRIYYNTFPKNEDPAHAQFLVQMDDLRPQETTRLIHELRATFRDIPGARIEVKEFLQGPPVSAPVEISIIGDDLGVLRREALLLEELIRAQPGTINIDNPSSRFRTDLRLAVNRDKAGLLGVPLDALDQTVRAGLAGIPVSTFRDRDGRDMDIVLTMPDTPDGVTQDRQRASVDRFERMHVATPRGTVVPVRQVARLTFESSPSLIEHLNLERVASVTADVADGYNVAETTARIVQALDRESLPAGYRYRIGGEEESREESFGGMGRALLIALLGIFAVLVFQFRSFRQPLIVFAAIPFAMTGAIVALLLTGYTFSFTAFVGLTSLVGIVVNNSIILVDYANRLRKEGRSVRDAMQEAGETRFVPIVLTTLTTIGGLLPLTLTGSSMWSPMGWAIIGGLSVSTLLTLIVVPVLYRLMTPEPR